MIKNIFIITVLCITSIISSFAQAKKNTIATQDTKTPYSDELQIGLDLYNAVINYKPEKIKSIVAKLILPYSVFKTHPNYYPENTNTTEPKYDFKNDSILYKKKMPDIYLRPFLKELLKEKDELITNKYRGNVYFVKDSKPISYSDDGIGINHLSIYFETEKEIKEITIEGYAKVDQNIFIIRSLLFYTYSKDNLPPYFALKVYDFMDVYVLKNKSFTKYDEDKLLFSNINYDNFLVRNVDITPKIENKTEEVTVEEQPIAEPEIYDRAEIMPSFPGGIEAMMKYLSKNLIYPKEAIEYALEGKIWLKFYVDVDGSLHDIVILKDPVGGGTADEAIRLVKSMPNWIPGKQNNKPVKVYYTLYVAFNLNK